MSQTYTYSITNDFPNQAVDVDTLTDQINASSISSGVLEGITLRTPNTDDCYIVFDVALSAPDVTTLDGVVAAHTGVPNPLFETSDAISATFRLVGYSAPGVPMMTLCQTNISGEWLFMENAIDNTAVVQFRQGGTGNPIFNLRNAAAISKIRLGPSATSYIISDSGFGIGTDAPNPSYGVDIAGSVNTDSSYRTGGVIVINSSKDLVNVRTANFNAEYSNGSQAGPSYTLNWNNGQKQVITLTGNITSLTLTAPSGVGNFLLRIVQDATGTRTITWPSSVRWAGALAPVLSTAANAVDIITFYYNGTNYYGVASLNFA
jgi:hypothetical protein